MNAINLAEKSTRIMLSRFTSERPDRLSKGFRLDKNGNLEKLKGGQLSLGTVETLSFDNITDVGALLQTIKPNNALSYGVCRHDKARVVGKKDLVRYKSDPNPTVARGRDWFSFASGPGLLMLDFDVAPGAHRLNEAEFRTTMYGIVPALEHAPHLIRPSASSHIFNGDQELRGAGGLRLLAHVSDASDIPRAGEALSKILWLFGHGRIEVGAAGQMLLRTLIDSSVFQRDVWRGRRGASDRRRLRFQRIFLRVHCEHPWATRQKDARTRRVASDATRRLARH